MSYDMEPEDIIFKRVVKFLKEEEGINEISVKNQLGIQRVAWFLSKHGLFNFSMKANHYLKFFKRI